MENQKINLSDSNNKNTTDQLIKFSNQLENISIIKSRLEHDNKILVNKINYIQLEHENERNMLKKIHNSEIEKKNKIIINLQEELSKLNTFNNENISNNYPQIINEYPNLEKKTKKISNNNFNLKSLIQDLQSKLIIYEETIKRKDNYIKELQNSLRNSEEELKIISIENETINEESKLIIEKINNEKNDLLEQNKEFRNAYEKFNIIINKANNKYIQKIQNFEDLILKKNLKLKEYEKEFNELNEKNHFLSFENENLKRKNDRFENTKKYRIQRNKSLNLNESKNISFYTSSSKKNHFENKTVDSIKENNNLNSNISINMYNNLDDPFIVSQQQSLDLFKNILQKYNI
jgi:chromosome segregation ATPase